MCFSHLRQRGWVEQLLNSRIDAQNDNLKDMRKLYDQARAQDEMDAAKITSVVQTAHAITPDLPGSPSKLLFLGSGLLIGFIASVGVLVFSLITNRTFFSEEAVERISGLPVLASVRLGLPHQRSLAG
jgi:capsular polysaccharide biosynthesis protein